VLPLDLAARGGPATWRSRCDAGHRAVLSLPTRRSSDLPTATCAPGGDRPSLHQRQSTALLGSRRSPASARSWSVRLGFQTDATRDRKSTRLNSSHVSISYAVFCLKKKPPGTGPLGSAGA